jgi:hypothetical protein
MKIDVCNKLVDNDLTRKDLLEKVEIKKTSEEDFDNICKTIAKAFDLKSPGEAAMQLIHSHVLIDESIKLVDKETGEIYGLLMFCEYPVSVGTPLLQINENLAKFLDEFKQVNGHSFVIDERLRGIGFDRKMLFHNIKFFAKNYDFIWCGVEYSLKSHNYWKKLGFIEIFDIPEATFYMLPFNEKLIN